MLNKIYLTIATLLIMSNSIATVSNGPYVGVNIGAANQAINYQASAFNLNTNGSQLYNPEWSFMSRLNLGYNSSKNNGFELGTSYFFSSDSNYPDGSGTMSTNTTSADISYLGYLPISQTKLSVFGRIGVAYDWVSTSSTSSLSPSGENFADILGAGLKYNINGKTTFRIEWLENGLFFPVGINSGSLNVASWSAQTFETGINYHF